MNSHCHGHTLCVLGADVKNTTLVFILLNAAFINRPGYAVNFSCCAIRNICLLIIIESRH